MNGADQGYLTIATEDPRYLEMAVDLALSLRAWDDKPVVLAADGALAPAARARYGSVFDDIALVPDRYLGGFLPKFCPAVVCDFDEIVYLDADCLVIADPASIWAGAGPAPITLVGERLGPAERVYHTGFSTRTIARKLGLPAYLKNNSGLFHVRRAGGPEALDACRACYLDELPARLSHPLLPWLAPNDENAFAVVGARLGFSLFPEPGPMYWAGERRALAERGPTKPVLHFIGSVPEAALAPILDGVRARREARGLPDTGSAEVWRWKARRSGRAMAAQGLLRRFVLRA